MFMLPHDLQEEEEDGYYGPADQHVEANFELGGVLLLGRIFMISKRIRRAGALGQGPVRSGSGQT